MPNVPHDIPVPHTEFGTLIPSENARVELFPAEPEIVSAVSVALRTSIFNTHSIILYASMQGIHKQHRHHTKGLHLQSFFSSLALAIPGSCSKNWSVSRRYGFV